MKRGVASIFVVVLAALAILFEATPQGRPIHAALAGWLAANALPKQTEIVTTIELQPSGGGGIRALDAALALRSVLRFGPRAIVFLDPIEPGDSEALLLSKLSDAKVPVVFTANERLSPLPGVEISKSLPLLPPLSAMLPESHPAGGTMPAPDGFVPIAAQQTGRAVASNAYQFCMTLENVSPANVNGKIPGLVKAGALLVPVNATGCAGINPLASRFVRTIAFDQLMLRTERNEQGAISVDLETLFRGQLVAIQNAGENRALGVAAIRNGLTESTAPAAWQWFGLFMVASLPWWRGSRVNRALLALGVSCMWLLMALAMYQEFRIALPLLFVALLPFLALIPSASRRSNEIEQRELPA